MTGPLSVSILLWIAGIIATSADMFFLEPWRTTAAARQWLPMYINIQHDTLYRYIYMCIFRFLADLSPCLGETQKHVGQLNRLVGTLFPNLWISFLDYIWLVVWNIAGLWLSIFWECHHPNWRSHIFQRGRYTTNQLCSMQMWIGLVSSDFDFSWNLMCIGWLLHKRLSIVDIDHLTLQ